MATCSYSDSNLFIINRWIEVGLIWVVRSAKSGREMLSRESRKDFQY